MIRRNQQPRNEERIVGLGVSEGLVVGRVLRIHDGTRNVYRATLEVSEIEKEIRRLRAAVRLARMQLLAIKARAEKEMGPERSYIFDAHLLMLQDKKLIGEIEGHIRNERSNAEWAVKVTSDRLMEIYAQIKDEYLRERGSDIEDVAQRILVALSGERPGYRNLSEDAVIVAEDLKPSAVAEMDLDHARGIATDAGGWTSHTAIIARALGIPSVVGLHNFYRRARTGDQIVIDASKGEVILHPALDTLARYTETVAKMPKSRPVVVEVSDEPLRTLDGVEVRLRANIELPAEFDGVRRFGARGVGLYRSEFLLSHRGTMPAEDEQMIAYSRVAGLAGDDGALIRLFDLGGDKTRAVISDGERNPALGLRAIRFGLTHESVLRSQVRAILRAAASGKLDIVLPMVADVQDVRRARAIIDEERVNLDRDGVKHGLIRIGAMIEVPSAVVMAESIAREVDFFSLGTNDLIQYLLAVDRGNDAVAEWFRSLHPAVLFSVKRILDVGLAAAIPSIVCGEMAATPAYAVILIGLGATDLSMSSSAIPRVRKAVAAIHATDAREVALRCLEFATADESEACVRYEFLRRWPEVFNSKNLPRAKEATGN